MKFGFPSISVREDLAIIILYGIDQKNYNLGQNTWIKLKKSSKIGEY